MTRPTTFEDARRAGVDVTRATEEIATALNAIGREGDPVEWVPKLLAAAKAIIPPDFIGKVEINAFKGGISNINLTQSFKGDTAK